MFIQSFKQVMSSIKQQRSSSRMANEAVEDKMNQINTSNHKKPSLIKHQQMLKTYGRHTHRFEQLFCIGDYEQPPQQQILGMNVDDHNQKYCDSSSSSLANHFDVDMACGYRSMESIPLPSNRFVRYLLFGSIRQQPNQQTQLPAAEHDQIDKDNYVERNYILVTNQYLTYDRNVSAIDDIIGLLILVNRYNTTMMRMFTVHERRRQLMVRSDWRQLNLLNVFKSNGTDTSTLEDMKYNETYHIRLIIFDRNIISDIGTRLNLSFEVFADDQPIEHLINQPLTITNEIHQNSIFLYNDVIEVFGFHI